MEKNTTEEQQTEPPEQIPQESPEENPEEALAQETVGPDLFSPMAIIMFSVAGLIDIIGFMLLPFAIIGIDDHGLLDLIGLAFIGGLMFLHSKAITNSKKSKKLTKKLFKRLGLTTLIELVPFLGSLAPSWTIAVFFHLREK